MSRRPHHHPTPPSFLAHICEGRGGDRGSSVTPSGAAVVLICNRGEVKIVKLVCRSLTVFTCDLSHAQYARGNAVRLKFNLRPSPSPRAPQPLHPLFFCPPIPLPQLFLPENVNLLTPLFFLNILFIFARMCAHELT